MTQKKVVIQLPLLPIVNTLIADDLAGLGFELMHAGHGNVGHSSPGECAQ
jgi:hypothetical protein